MPMYKNLPNKRGAQEQPKLRSHVQNGVAANCCHYYCSWCASLFLHIIRKSLLKLGQAEWMKPWLRRFALPPSIRECRKDTLQTEVMNSHNGNFPVLRLCLRYRRFSVLLNSHNVSRLHLCSIRMFLKSFTELSHRQ